MAGFPQRSDLDRAHEMDRYRDRSERFSLPGPAARSASPTRTSFVRSNTPSPEETMAARLRAENAEWPLIDDDDNFAPPAPSTPTRSAERASTGATPQSTTTSPAFGTAGSTTTTAAPGGLPNSFLAPFDTRQQDLILYLALRGASKAAIASILRSELPGSQVPGSELRRYGPVRWEQMTEPRIKAVLEALVEIVGEDQDWARDATFIIGRVMVSANAGDWRNSVLVRAADHMIAARQSMDRGEIRKARREEAKKRNKEKKKAVDSKMEQLVRASGINTGSDDPLQSLVDHVEAGSERQQLDVSYNFLASEDDMLGNLVDLQDNGVLCGQQLFNW